MDDLISSQTTRLLAKALDGVSKRHTAIASNIANAETPGYNALSVNFEDSLKAALDDEQGATDTASQTIMSNMLRTTTGKHLGLKGAASSFHDGQSHLGAIERATFEYGQDKNGVDIESQMAQLAKNSGRYAALSRLEGRMFNSLRAVIKGSGGG